MRTIMTKTSAWGRMAAIAAYGAIMLWAPNAHAGEGCGHVPSGTCCFTGWHCIYCDFDGYFTPTGWSCTKGWCGDQLC
jgi:hypothetical protein